jgi:Flp pilus assembly protein TadD
MALDPELPASYLARGTVRSAYLWDWEGTRSDFQRAIALAPGDPGEHLVYAIFLRDTGDLSSAAVELHQAAELDPLDRMIPNNLGIVYDWQGKHALARTAFRHAKELIQDPAYDAAEIAFTYLLEGQLKAAQEWGREVELGIGAPPWPRSRRARARRSA